MLTWQPLTRAHRPLTIATLDDTGPAPTVGCCWRAYDSDRRRPRVPPVGMRAVVQLVLAFHTHHATDASARASSS